MVQLFTVCTPVEDDNLVCNVEGLFLIVGHQYAGHTNFVDDVLHRVPQ